MQRLYVAWQGYQRRAEVLAPRFASGLAFFPNRFKNRFLRPLDYLLKLFATRAAISRSRARLLVFQSPPPYPALAALIAGVPYAIDAHNASIQGRWTRAPLAGWIVAKSALLIAHNPEAAEIASKLYPRATVLSLRDPLSELPGAGASERREPDSVLCICSFAVDEPLDVLYALTRARPGLRFLVSGNPRRTRSQWVDRLADAGNVTLTGYLPTADYQALLGRVGAVVVLTTRAATQPSGACEALSADAPLVVSRTSLTQAMFGDWARVVPNEPELLAEAVDAALADQRSLSQEREAWNRAFEAELTTVRAALARAEATNGVGERG